MSDELRQRALRLLRHPERYRRADVEAAARRLAWQSGVMLLRAIGKCENCHEMTSVEKVETRYGDAYLCTFCEDERAEEDATR